MDLIKFLTENGVDFDLAVTISEAFIYWPSGSTSIPIRPGSGSGTA